MYIVQSVVFRKEDATLGEAKRFLKKHGYANDNDVDITEATYRFRQEDPNTLKKQGYRFKTKEFPLGFFIMAYKH